MKPVSQAINLSTSLLIDPTIEPLKIILPSYQGITHVPSDIDGPALMVFVELQKCFQKAGKVCEGLLPNVMWGFEQCGYDPQHVAAGLYALRMKGYISYSDEGGLTVSEIAYNPKRPVWIRYEKKFLDVLVKNEASEGKVFQSGINEWELKK